MALTLAVMGECKQSVYCLYLGVCTRCWHVCTHRTMCVCARAVFAAIDHLVALQTPPCCLPPLCLGHLTFLFGCCFGQIALYHWLYSAPALYGGVDNIF